MTPTGVSTEFTMPTPEPRPDGIAVGPDGTLWFTENGGNKIGRITPEGAITEFPCRPRRQPATGSRPAPTAAIWFTES